MAIYGRDEEVGVILMKGILIAVICVLLVGCVEQVADSMESEHMEQSAPIMEKTDDLIEKYKFDCANVADHSFDYEMQQAKVDECYARCCGGSYCQRCEWEEYGECYNDCEAGLPEGVCSNCDGVCWEKGFEKFLDGMIRSC